MSNHDREGSRPSNRDVALERAWREASAEQPPSRLDAALIAAAHKEAPDRGEQTTTAVPVGTRSRNRLTQWQPLAAAAAVTGLAFVLVQMLPREPNPTGVGQAPRADGLVDRRDRIADPDRSPAQRAVPAPPASAALPAIKAEAAASNSAAPADAGYAADAVEKVETAPAVGDTAPRAEATERDAEPTTDTEPALGELGTDRRKAGGSEVTGRAATTATAAPSFPARERSLDASAPLDATTWAAKIVALNESGDFNAAEDALRAFRASDPDADSYLPDSLRDWARTVE